MASSTSIFKQLASSTGKKIIMAVTGLALIGFTVTHLAGNLLLLLPSGDAFNRYAHMLMELGFLLYVAELGLVVLFLLHIFTAISLSIQNRSARPITYAATKTRLVRSKKGPSKANWGSTHMIFTGMFLSVFLVIHIWQFKFGPGIAEGYETMIDGTVTRDLYALVVETFKNPIFLLMYCMCMVFLGIHLRHGAWSLFQSLGIAFPHWSGRLYQLAFLVGAGIGGGFFMIPIWIYFDLSRFLPSAVLEMFL